MSTLLSARNLEKSFAQHTLFSGVEMQIVADDRLGFIGPNGAGKSTLLKILAGLESQDDGEVTRRRASRLVYVPQDDVLPDDATPRSAIIERLERDADDGRVDFETRGAITLSRLGFDDVEQPVRELSGGWRKRLSIACAIVLEPDALMLDEPTNHLDLEGILWLEQFVQQARMAVVFVTHDRRFLENVARRIIELSPAYPGGLFEVRGNYTEFVRRKAEFLDGQATAESSLANKVRRDNAWLLQGIKARETRNKTQLDDTFDRRAELKAVRDRNAAPTKTASIDFQATARKTKKLLALHGIAKAMGDKRLFEGLDLVLSPGRRIGLMGANGAGKTTLLRIIGGDLEPDAGTVKPAADLRIITFSQHRDDLNAKQTLQEALCPVGEIVEYRGRSMHVTGWASKFLFAPNQLSTFVGNLSGGEQARLLIARLMLEPADVLLLDEPTNDLDIPSLEVLEQALLEFPGAIVLITHDRFMLERIATEFLAIEDGHARAYASYTQWEATQTKRAKPGRKTTTTAARKDKPASTPRKLSYNIQRELDGMEGTILVAESEVERLETATAEPDVMADHTKYADLCHQLGDAQRRVAQLYERWAELAAM